MARFAVLLLTVCLTACSVPPAATPVANAAQVAQAPGVGGALPTSASGRPEPVTLWQDAEIFRLVAGLIESARTHVMVEMYELGRRDLVSELGAAHARGVAVQVITDPTVNASRRSVVLLDKLHVPERVYPVDDVRHQIDHVKVLIADDEAVVGGMNWGAHSSRNHDYVLETHVQTEIARLTRIFVQDWDLAGGHPAPLATARSEIAQTAPGEEIRAMLEGALGRAVWAISDRSGGHSRPRRRPPARRPGPSATRPQPTVQPPRAYGVVIERRRGALVSGPEGCAAPRQDRPFRRRADPGFCQLDAVRVGRQPRARHRNAGPARRVRVRVPVRVGLVEVRGKLDIEP